MGRLIRKTDWAECLHHLISDRLYTPFKWGEHDCALFAADAVHCITGEDPAASIRGTYSTAAGAAAALAGLGIADVSETPAAFLDADKIAEVEPCCAQRGDILQVANQDGQPMLAVCIGAQCASPSANGLHFQPISNAVKAWRLKFTR